MPAGVTWGRYLRFTAAAMLSMFAGSQTIHMMYRPLDVHHPRYPQGIRINLHYTLDASVAPFAGSHSHSSQSAESPLQCSLPVSTKIVVAAMKDMDELIEKERKKIALERSKS